MTVFSGKERILDVPMHLGQTKLQACSLAIPRLFLSHSDKADLICGVLISLACQKSFLNREMSDTADVYPSRVDAAYAGLHFHYNTHDGSQ